MKQCTKCLGSGLIGSGENPHLQEGHKKTCDECGGTGQVADGEASSDEPAEQTVDKPKRGGVLGMLGFK